MIPNQYILFLFTIYFSMKTKNLTHSSYRAVFGPQINSFNKMFNWYFIFQSVVLLFLYVEQDVNFA